MIITILLYLISFALSIVISLTDFIAQGWSIWPDTLLTGITYFFTQLMNFDFIFNIVALLTAIKWLVGFEIIYLGIKLSLKIVNFIRGTGKIDLE